MNWNACIISTLAILLSTLVYAQPVTLVHEGDTLWVHPTDNHTSTPWGAYAQHIDGVHHLADGYANTASYAKQISSGWVAALVCYHLDAFGYTDWYLPSSEELQNMYQNKEQIGGFSDHWYWSSTSATNRYDAHRQHFGTGEKALGSRDYFHHIRCVRR